MTAALRDHGIRPSAQRVAIAGFVLRTDVHPSADRVWQEVRRTFPAVSRATVYNTLNLFVRQGLLRQFQFDEGPAVFDANVVDHHHLVDEDSGNVLDVPWDALEVRVVDLPGEYEVESLQVVLRGRKRP